MVLSEAQRNLVLQDFLDIFQQIYGDQWMYGLSGRLTPSPNKRIAKERAVKLYHVKRIRAQLKVIGYYFELLRSLSSPIPLSTYQPILDESHWF